MGAFSCTFWYCAMVTLLGIITKSKEKKIFFIRYIYIEKLGEFN